MSRLYFLYTNTTIDNLESDEELTIRKQSLTDIDFLSGYSDKEFTDIDTNDYKPKARYCISDPFKNCMILSLDKHGSLDTITTYGLNNEIYILYRLVKDYNVGIIYEDTYHDLIYKSGIGSNVVIDCADEIREETKEILEFGDNINFKKYYEKLNSDLQKEANQKESNFNDSGNDDELPF